MDKQRIFCSSTKNLVASMAHSHPPLPWLRAFEAAARLRSFTLAAAELGLTPAAVSYQVRALEAELGYPLFARKTRALEPTRMAELYLPWVARAFGDLSRATDEVFGRQGQRAVRLRCLSSLAQLWLIPRLPRWQASNPEVQVTLNVGSWSGMMDPGQLDLDIRYGDGSSDGTQGEQLRAEHLVAVCAPALRLAGKTRAALAAMPLIDILGVVDTWESYLGTRMLPVPVFRVDQSATALALAAEGLGVALVWHLFAAPYLADGRLVRALPIAEDQATPHDLRLVMADNPTPPRAEVLLFRDWLFAEMAAT